MLEEQEEAGNFFAGQGLAIPAERRAGATAVGRATPIEHSIHKSFEI